MEDPLLHVFAAVLTVFPGRAPANPMKVHNVLFVTFGAYALHLVDRIRLSNALGS